MAHRLMRHGWQVAVVATLAGGLLVGGPLTSVAAGSTVRATGAAAAANTYGGETSQGWPVVVKMSTNRRQIVRALAAVDLTCAAGGAFTFPAALVGLPVSKAGRFARSFGPLTIRNDDGTTSDIRGRIAGRLNAAGSRLAGTVSLGVTDHDQTGAVTDNCASGAVRWTATQ